MQRQSSCAGRILLSLLLSLYIGPCASICVLDNKKGWWLDCGVRDSYLFRIKDFGGITARFDFGLGLGDEPGFPHSISNTNKAPPLPPHLRVAPPLKAPIKFSRSGAGVDNVRRNDEVLQRRSSSVMPFPLNLFVPRASKEQESPRPPKARKDSRPPKYRRFQSTSGEELPPVIPADDNKGYWVRLPVEQVVKDGQHAGVRYSPEEERHRGQRRRQEHVAAEDGWLDAPLEGAGRPMLGGREEEEERRRLEYKAELLRKLREEPQYSGVPYSRHSDHRNLPGPIFREPQRLESVTLNTIQSHLSGGFRSPPPLQGASEPTGPMIGEVLGEVLQISPTTPADTQHVPSFAAQTLVVRDAPANFHPPGYKEGPHYSMTTRLPRTEFFCEEQKFLPGMYADVQLGCKIFHLCIPAPLGSSMASFLCPNSTLFDQSILQCNYWQLVDCSASADHYDANQPLALSYRRVNAAYLPPGAAQDPLTLSLLEDIRA